MENLTFLHPTTDLRTLTTQVILQNLRNAQLLLRLEKEGQDMDDYFLDLLTPIGLLMGLAPGEISDFFVEVYALYIDRSEEYPVTGRGEALKPLAEECYAMLLCCAEMEKRKRS